MSFWEDLGETISVKGKEVADKAKNITDIAGLKGQIATCENTIQKNYKEIGKKYYEIYADKDLNEFSQQMTAIKNAKNAEEELKKKISQIRGTKHCNHCGADVDEHCDYCPKCGSKLEEAFYDEGEESTELKDIIKEEDIID